ncbi:uncharacterized protein KY384_004320 [Bacidia gigantensis]|uniref:uncharacterized protein n=1 Tax=Bacidia gigantensis TaxID=2732470 RepID=UPI001D056D2A|nr:uncharacterized protein KY384_004320 [Bacidia gigantensis]KAG8530963.1 hypothetical protein KY384_004320 [Bacidia gigantensis]
MPPPSHLSLSLPALLVFAARVSSKNIWHVSIYNGPAKAPGKGAPIQASALRDKSYLPAQIASIVAAYVFSVVVIGSALLLVGRRLRRAAQTSPTTLSMEMVKPVKTDVPRVFDPSPASKGASPNSAVDMRNNWPSPIKEFRGSVNWGSLKKEHKRRPSESQASVVTFDESVIEDDRARNEREMDRLYAAVAAEDEKRSTSKIDLAGHQQSQHPPELQHLRNEPQSIGPPPRRQRAAHLPPMGSPGLAPDYDDGYGEKEPLSPRFYPDPGPPPPTPDEHKAGRQRPENIDVGRFSPRDSRFPMTSLRKGGSVPQSPTVPTIREVESQPQLLTVNTNRSMSSNASRVKPAPLPLRTITAGSTSNQYLPLRGTHPTNYNADLPQPSPAIKATVIERKAPVPRLRTPGTGVPMTPYSPYMPNTPLTPMTPSRLVSREERRRKMKEDGRRVPTIEDAVEEDADEWGAIH